MADADPDGKGGMAAILKLNREAVNEIAKAAAEATGEILIVANHNTPAPVRHQRDQGGGGSGPSAR